MTENCYCGCQWCVLQQGGIPSDAKIMDVGEDPCNEKCVCSCCNRNINT